MTMVSPGRISLLLVCGSFNLGGSERNVVKIATGLDPGRFRVRVLGLTGAGPLRAALEARQVPVSAVGWSFDPRRLHEDLARLQSEVERAAPDIVHIFNYPTVYFGISAGVQAGVPVRLVAIQAWDTWKGSVEWCMDRLIRPAVTLYLVDGDGARRFAIRQQGLDPGRVRLAYDGPDVDELVPTGPPKVLRERLGLSPDCAVVGMVARLQDVHKGQSVFLRAVARIPEGTGAQFVLVGEGEDDAKLRKLATDLGVASRVVFAGANDQLADVLHALDILVVPSRRFESVPKILLEGMATARPVVATRVGDIAEFVEDGKTGLLVEPENSDALASAIMYLLAQPEEARILGEGARASLISRGITLHESLAALSDLYLRLSGSVKARPDERLKSRMRRAMAAYRILRLTQERGLWLLGRRS
jgi:glycosyltransferase involved in cell wall biosynthesis